MKKASGSGTPRLRPNEADCGWARVKELVPGHTPLSVVVRLYAMLHNVQDYVLTPHPQTAARARRGASARVGQP